MFDFSLCADGCTSLQSSTVLYHLYYTFNGRFHISNNPVQELPFPRLPCSSILSKFRTNNPLSPLNANFIYSFESEALTRICRKLRIWLGGYTYTRMHLYLDICTIQRKYYKRKQIQCINNLQIYLLQNLNCIINSGLAQLARARCGCCSHLQATVEYLIMHTPTCQVGVCTYNYALLDVTLCDIM